MQVFFVDSLPLRFGGIVVSDPGSIPGRRSFYVFCKTTTITIRITSTKTNKKATTTRNLSEYKLGSLDSESRVLTITPWNLTNNLKQKSFTNLSHSSTVGRQSLSELKVAENEKQEEQEQVKNNKKDN